MITSLGIGNSHGAFNTESVVYSNSLKGGLYIYTIHSKPIGKNI